MIEHSGVCVCVCVCGWVGVQMTIVKGEDCTLLDNSRRIRWRVRNSAGIEGLVPAICFYIPPPNKDAEELAKKYVMHNEMRSRMTVSEDYFVDKLC